MCMYAENLCESLMENHNIHTDNGQKKSNSYRYLISVFHANAGVTKSC